MPRFTRLEREAHALLDTGPGLDAKGPRARGGGEALRVLQGETTDRRRPAARRNEGASFHVSGPRWSPMSESRPTIVAVLQRLLAAWSSGEPCLRLLPDRAACEVYSAERQTEALVRAFEGAPAAHPFVPGSVDVPPSLREDSGEATRRVGLRLGSESRLVRRRRGRYAQFTDGPGEGNEGRVRERRHLHASVRDARNRGWCGAATVAAGARARSGRMGRHGWRPERTRCRATSNDRPRRVRRHRARPGLPGVVSISRVRAARLVVLAMRGSPLGAGRRHRDIPRVHGRYSPPVPIVTCGRDRRTSDDDDGGRCTPGVSREAIGFSFSTKDSVQGLRLAGDRRPTSSPASPEPQAP